MSVTPTQSATLKDIASVCTDTVEMSVESAIQFVTRVRAAMAQSAPTVMPATKTPSLTTTDYVSARKVNTEKIAVSKRGFNHNLSIMLLIFLKCYYCSNYELKMFTSGLEVQVPDIHVEKA